MSHSSEVYFHMNKTKITFAKGQSGNMAAVRQSAYIGEAAEVALTHNRQKHTKPGASIIECSQHEWHTTDSLPLEQMDESVSLVNRVDRVWNGERSAGQQGHEGSNGCSSVFHSDLKLNAVKERDNNCVQCLRSPNRVL